MRSDAKNKEVEVVLRDWTQVNCPECGHKVKLSDELEGHCEHCRLDVGAVIQRHRHEQALAKLREAEEAERKAQQKKKDLFEW